MSAGLGTGWTTSGPLANSGLTEYVGHRGQTAADPGLLLARVSAHASPTSMNTSAHAWVMAFVTLVMAAS